MAARLSIVIDSYNEANVISRCLDSVKGIADEIIVCDESSSDNTVEIAKKYGAKVIKHNKVQYVELIRNFEVSKATGDWVLVLDPDEEVSKPLAKKILEVIKHPDADYYFLQRKNIIFGKWIKNSRWWPDLNLRLFKKGTVKWSGVIHVQPSASGNGKNIEEDDDQSILHHHYESVEQYIERMNRYTSVAAENMIKGGYVFNWHDLISKPAAEFFSRYFFGKGYRDGIHGLALCALQGFYELVTYLKVWQANKFKQEELKLKEVVSEMTFVQKDLNYWQNDALYKETGSFAARVKRKLRI